MKSAALLLFILAQLLLCTTAIAQADFAPLGSVWYYSFKDDQEEGYTLQKSVSDTLILNQQCRKIERTLFKKSIFNVNDPVAISVLSPHFVYATADTVFYFNNVFSKFLPLYIFNVAVGDTIRYHVPYVPPTGPLADSFFRVVVTSITTRIIDGHPVRTVYNQGIDGAWGFYGQASRPYTERLGCEEGLLTHAYGNTTANIVRPIIRCYNDDLISYRNDQVTNCTQIGPVGIREHEALQASVTVYPNPAGKYLAVKCDHGNQIVSLHLQNAVGQQISASNNTSLGKSIVLPLEGVAKGIYFLTVNTKQGSLARKIYVK